MSEAARRPERDGGRPPSLSLVAGVSVSRRVPRGPLVRTLSPSSLCPAGAPGQARRGAPAWVGGAGRVPEVTCSAREAEAATAVAELQSCAVHLTLTLSPGSNRKSQLHHTSVYEAISTLFGLRVQCCLVHALTGFPVMCLLPFVEDCTPLCLHPGTGNILRRSRGAFFSQRICKSQWRVPSSPARCISLSLCPQRYVSSLSFSLYPRHPNLRPRPPFFETESHGFSGSRGLEGLEQMGESALHRQVGWG